MTQKLRQVAFLAKGEEHVGCGVGDTDRTTEGADEDREVDGDRHVGTHELGG